MITFDAAVDLSNGDNLRVSLGYNGEYGDTTENHSAGFEIGFKF